MGGNTKALDNNGNVIIYNGKEAIPEPLVLNSMDFADQLISTMRLIDEEHKRQYNFPVWKENYLKYFVGSSYAIFRNDLLQFKNTFGDIDILVPKHFQQSFRTIIENIKTPIQFVGHNRFNQENPTSINCVYDYNGSLLQIDFLFEDEELFEWHRFSKSSHEDDLKNGIKGVFHKYLLMALTRNIEKTNGRLLTPKSSIENPKFSKNQPTVMNAYTFSVQYGIRTKYTAVGELNGENLIKVEYSDPINNIDDICEVLGVNRDQITNFVGLATHVQILENFDDILMDFVDKIWGPNAQPLYRDDWEQDLKEKSKALRYLYADGKLYSKIQQHIMDYYGINGAKYLNKRENGF